MGSQRLGAAGGGRGVSDAGAERRVDARKPFRSTAYLALPGRPPSTVRTVDLSAGGVGIIAADNPPPKSACMVRLMLPVKGQGPKAFDVQARVAHSVYSSKGGGFLIGLQFTSLGPDVAAAVIDFLAS